MSSAIIILRGSPREAQGLFSPRGSRPADRQVNAMARKKGRKHTSKKQRRDYLSGVHHTIAALYWFVRLILLLWDKFSG